MNVLFADQRSGPMAPSMFIAQATGGLMNAFVLAGAIAVVAARGM